MASDVFCDGCGGTMILYKNRDTCIYRCSVCGMSQSARRGMSCENSRLPLQVVIKLIAAWYDHASLATAAARASTTVATACRWYHICRQMCHNHVRTTSQPIGGPGTVDEVLLFRRKYQRGRMRQQVWVVGGIERPHGPRDPSSPMHIFMERVPNRRGPTLEGVVTRNILPGTRVHTDMWRGYSGLNSIGYDHRTVNHSRYFVHPGDRETHTQTIECLWHHLRQALPRGGIRPVHIDLYMSDFVYRKTTRATKERAIRDALYLTWAHTRKKKKKA